MLVGSYLPFTLGEVYMAARRKFYKVQAEAIGELLRETSFGHYTVIGPREPDGDTMVLRLTPTVREAWVIRPNGTRRKPDTSTDDPADFGGLGQQFNG
jgi:hypothetical protein